MTPCTRTILSWSVAICAAALLAPHGDARAAGPLQFSDFPVMEAFDGPASPLDEATAPPQWAGVGDIHKEIAREEMVRGPNFAGAYYLATVGCGTGCEAIFVIDMRDGRIHAAPEAASNGVLYQKDSRLIIIKENATYDLPRLHFVFEDGRFRQVE